MRVIALLSGAITNISDLTDPLDAWRNSYRGGLTAQPAVQYLLTTTDCAKASYATDTGYILSYNQRCIPLYRTAAMGHILRDAAHSNYTPTVPDDMLVVPPRLDAHITYASVKAMPRYGEPVLCQYQLNCHKRELCKDNRCKPDNQKVQWVMLASFLVVTALLLAVCMALANSAVSTPPYSTVDNTNYATPDECPDPENSFSVVRLAEPTAPLIESTEIEMNTV